MGSRCSSKASRASGGSSVPDEWEVVAGDPGADLGRDQEGTGTPAVGEVKTSDTSVDDEGDDGWEEARREA